MLNGVKLVAGIEIQILREGQVLEMLPDGSGIQLDFPSADGVGDQFVALYGNGNAWIEITQETSGEQALSN